MITFKIAPFIRVYFVRHWDYIVGGSKVPDSERLEGNAGGRTDPVVKWWNAIK